MFKKTLLKIIPQFILAKLFPSKFSSKLPRFFQVFDDFSNKNLHLFLREDSFMERVIFEKGLYEDWEKESLKIWAFLSQKSNSIIDIGANTGIFSLIAQNNNTKAKIIAIEPINTNFEVLTKNIIKNKFNIIAEKVALSDKSGTAKMFMLKDKLNYMTSVNDNRYNLHPEVKGEVEVVEIEVSTKPFSYIVEKHKLDCIDLIKIDVEGHELQVLESMTEYLHEHKPTILIEIIGDDLASKVDLFFNNIGGYNYISIDEKNVSKIVTKIWDNDHHNFLICSKDKLNSLKQAKLVN